MTETTSAKRPFFRLPSVDRMVAAAWAVARRFPLTLACAAVSAFAGMNLVEAQPDPEYIRLLAASSLGLPLFAAIRFVADRWGLRTSPLWLCRVGGVAALVWFWAAWPSWGEELAAIRYFHASVTLHLGVAVCAYVGRPETRGFWEFNRTLFFRFLLGAVYTFVLWGGLSLALLGIDNLFGIEIDELNYGRLFFFFAFVFQTFFFLAGAPDDFEDLEGDKPYPIGLKVFAQYVLLPLVSIYLVILTAYFGRVVITTTWPSGWIGNLVSALAAFGIFSLLMVHPQRGVEGSRWIGTYARVFWFALLPSIAMLLLAVFQRIGQYGITEARYMLLVLSFWLAGVALYYVVTRSKGIRAIPLTLAVVGLLTFPGPWSAYAVSERSQVGRLEELLVGHEVLIDGRVVPREASIVNADWRQINDIVFYLFLHHGTDRVDDWFDGGVAAVDTLGADPEVPPVRRARDRTRLVVDYLALESEGGLTPGRYGDARIFAAAEGGGSVWAISATGFDHVIPATNLLDVESPVADENWQLEATTDSLGVVVTRGDAPPDTISFLPLIARSERSGLTVAPGSVRMSPDSLVLEAALSRGAAMRLHVTELFLAERDGTRVVERARGTVLINRRSPGT